MNIMDFRNTKKEKENCLIGQGSKVSAKVLGW